MKNIYAMYKPKGPTSHDIVEYIRRITGIQKVGHAGTLDPLAEGVLVVGIGRDATKNLSSIVQKEKEYIARITLGTSSTTDDAEGEKTIFKVMEKPTKQKIEKVLTSFVGEISQTPPLFSALKVRGKPAYVYAQKGEDILLMPRRVIIHDITLLSYTWPTLAIHAHTGPGVYIRALARDIGDVLECGAYMSGLIRTRVGPYKKENALTLEAFGRYWKKSGVS